jgi:hypothetical protein
MEKSKFELFQKNKIEGLQQILGGQNATVVVEGGNRKELVGHVDTWYPVGDGPKTGDWSNLDGSDKGDLVVFSARVEPNSVVFEYVAS